MRFFQRRYRYFVAYEIFNAGRKERGGYRIIRCTTGPDKIDDEFFSRIGKAMGVRTPLEIQFTAFNRL